MLGCAALIAWSGCGPDDDGFGASGWAAGPVQGTPPGEVDCAALQPQWVYTYGNSLDREATAIVPAGDGSFIVVGTQRDKPYGSDDALLLGIGADGIRQWTHSYDPVVVRTALNLEIYRPAAAARGVGATLLDDGGLLLVANQAPNKDGQDTGWLLWLDADKQPVKEAVLDIGIVRHVALSNGEHAVMGAAGDAPSHVQHLDSVGAVVTDTAYERGEAGRLVDMALTADGKLAVAGAFTTSTGDQQTWVAMTQLDGTLLWERWLGGACDDSPWSIAAHPDGGVVLAVHVPGGGKAPGKKGPWLVHLAADGAVVWDRVVGVEAAIVAGTGLRVQPDGRILMAGGAPTLKPNGQEEGTDWWIAETAADGQLRWSSALTMEFSAGANALLPLADGLVIAGRGPSSGGNQTRLGVLRVALPARCPNIEPEPGPPAGVVDCAEVTDTDAVGELPGGPELRLDVCGLQPQSKLRVSLLAEPGAVATATTVCVGEALSPSSLPATHVALSNHFRIHPAMTFDQPVRLGIAYHNQEFVTDPDDVVLFHDAHDGAGYRLVETTEVLDNIKQIGADILTTGTFVVAGSAP